jgi:microcystin-dependent protein
MSGLNLSLAPGTVPANDPLPSSAQALINYVSEYTGIQGGTAFNGINFGPNTPSPQNRGLPWFKTDAYGNPIGLFSWNGSAWVTIPTGVSAGSTANRPASPSNGSTYYDTTIGALILWNGTVGAWTTASGTVGDIKEVITADLPTALTNNPGWVQETTTLGYVIGAASTSGNGAATAHAQGSLIGEETHTLTVAEIAPHTHAEIYGTYTGQHQNGSQPSGVYPAVTPGSSGIPVASTASAGGGGGHNNIQPTAYLWRLVKQF